MKTLYLLRHGHAETHAKHPDISRNLDDKGRAEARETGEKMRKLGYNPALIISSPANRAYQTACIVAETLGYNVKNIEIEDDAYNADVDTLKEVIARQEDKFHSLMLTGHNPGISELAQNLAKNYERQMHTAELVAFEISANSWDSFAQFDVKLVAGLDA